MARRLVAASAGAGGRAPAYGGLLLDAGGTLLQVARPVAETYASIGRRYGPYASNPKNPPPRTFSSPSMSLVLCISSNVWRVVGLVVFLTFGPSPGVTKPEKRIMEGFKRAFSAPWPKTLRYQVMEMRRTGIAFARLEIVSWLLSR
jgi:hypothetical protein